MPKNIPQLVRDEIQEHGSEWVDYQFVRLGDLSGVVLTAIPGVLNARLYNGKVIPVHNTANVPPVFDLHLKVGRSKSLPTIWQIIEVMEDYPTPAAGGQIAYHHEQHEEGGGDRLNLHRKQIVQLSVRVFDAAGFVVRVFGDVVPMTTGLKMITTQNIDLSSYVVTSGAKYVSIEADDDGVLSIHDGTAFGAPDIATVADIPALDPGMCLVAYILFFDGQDELLDEHIHVPFPLGMVAKDSGLQINDAAADTPADGDKFGFWDIVDALLKSITWANIKSLLKTYSDGFYSVLGHTHESDGSGELVMEDGVTFPPVPVTTEDGTDWIYSD